MKPIRFLLIIIFATLSMPSSAQYLQADRLDIVGRTRDPELMMNPQVRNIQVRQLQLQRANYVELNPPYIYVNANPVNFTDPTGLTPAGAAGGAIIGGIIGGILGGGVGTLAGPGGTVIMGGEGIGEGAAAGAIIGDKVSNLMCKDDCQKEWDDAYRMCEDLIGSGNNGVTGGYTNLSQCARGLVSQRCGGNRVL